MTKICAALVGFLSASLPAGARGEEKLLALQLLDDELAAEYESSIAELQAKYQQALEKLKAEYLQAGDLDSTLAVAEELGRLESSRAGTAGSGPAPGAIAGPGGTFLLTPALALTGVPVAHDPTHDLLTGWKAGGFAEWPLADVARGTYSVTLRCYSGPFAGGRLVIEAAGTSRELEVQGSGNWDEEKTFKLGTVTVATGGESLRLSVTGARPIGALELREIVLVPIGAPPPSEPAKPGPAPPGTGGG